MSWDIHNLFLRHARDINRFLRKRGHTVDTADDLTQDTFVRVLASPPAQTSLDHNPRAYLYRVSRNLSINYKRRENLIQVIELPFEDSVAAADPTPSAERIVYSRQCLEQTKNALAELPPRSRAAYELYRLDGRTIAEVGKQLGLSTSRTWVLIKEAYRHLLARVDDL